MKLIIEREALLKTLVHMQTIVERRNTIPILSNVLIEVSDGILTLTATDTDLTIVDTVSVDMEEPGAVTVPGHTLHDIVRKMPSKAPIKISTHDDSKIRVRAGRSVFTLATLPKSDFPVMGSDDLPHTFTLQPGELRNLIDRTRFAMSTEETRYFLNGIYLHVVENIFRAVATDGHRLARFEMPLPEGASDMLGIIVPRKTVGELRKLIDETDQPVDVALSDTKIRFSFDATVLSSKLVAGTFPDYHRVIPVGNDKIVQVNCSDFADAVDRVSTIAWEKNHAVNLVIEDSTMTLLSKTNIGDDAVEKVEIDYDNSTLEVGFNFKYLLDVVQQINGEYVKFEFADSRSPVLIYDTSDSSALYVLMPMRY